MDTKRICYIAVMAATVSVSKLALAIIPNVEIVTAILVSLAIVLEMRDSLFVSLAFVLIEFVIYGFALWWSVLYIIYWPLLVLIVGMVARRARQYNCDNAGIVPRLVHNKRYIILAVIVGIAMTGFFGVLSSLIEAILVLDISSFVVVYIAGLPFFVVHIVSNAIILPILVPVLLAACSKINIYPRLPLQ